MKRTQAQRERQNADYRLKGKYAKVNPCYACGKSHKGKRPPRCSELSAIMSAVCKRVETWKAMRVLETRGVAGLWQLADELGIVSLPKDRRQ